MTNRKENCYESFILKLLQVELRLRAPALSYCLQKPAPFEKIQFLGDFKNTVNIIIARGPPAIQPEYNCGPLARLNATPKPMYKD